MVKGVKKEFILEGLDCSNCAAKIEANVNKISGVASASMNFATKTLVIEAGNDTVLDKVISDANNIIKRLEPNVLVKEKIISKQSRKILILVGLGCAHCAAKIEKEVKNLPGVRSASIDF